VRRWHREGRLRPGQYFSWSWTWGGEPSGNIGVRTEASTVVLMYRLRNYGDAEWRSVEQRVPITWTACHIGGHRAWFICSAYSGGRYCGRRVALLYGAGELFACRCCYGLAYASQHEALHHRGLGKARKIRMQLGGSPNTLEEFPDKPKGMHWRTYDRLRRARPHIVLRMERESKSQLSIRVEAELRQQFERLAREEDRPLSYEPIPGDVSLPRAAMAAEWLHAI